MSLCSNTHYLSTPFSFHVKMSRVTCCVLAASTSKCGAGPFTVRSTPDFENTNEMEQNTIT